MKSKSKFNSLVHPSISSLLTGSIIVGWLVLSSLWSVAKNAPYIREYLDDSSIQSTAITEASNSVGAIGSAIFSGTTFNQLIYLCTWAFVGILCYFLFAMVLMGFSDVKLSLLVSKKSKYGSNGFQSLYELGLRLAFRLLMAIGLTFGLIMFFQAIIPVASLTIKAGSGFNDISSFLYVLIGAILVGLYLHILLIMLRLFFLRERLFNMADEVVLNR